MEFKLEDATVDQFQCVWNNNGKYGPAEGDTVKLQDALSVPSGRGSNCS